MIFYSHSKGAAKTLKFPLEFGNVGAVWKLFRAVELATFLERDILTPSQVNFEIYSDNFFTLTFKFH